MNIFKKIFCDHHYEHYHTGEYTHGWSKAIQWNYVCKKCSGTTSIRYWDIEHESERVHKKVSKENAFSDGNDEYVDLRFYIGCFIFKGKNAYYMKEKYNYIYQDDAIPQMRY